MKKLVGFSIIGVFLISVVGFILTWLWYANLPNSEISKEVIYEISPGKNLRGAARELEALGVVRNADMFLALAKIRGQANKIKIGEYALNANMRPSEIIAILNSGKSLERRITLAEGLSIFEIAEILSAAGFGSAEQILKTLRDPVLVKNLLGAEYHSLEGYLYPETYSYTKYTELKSLLTQMVRRFEVVYADIQKTSQVQGFSKHQIVTLASIVEKETGLPQDRGKISSVFHNRIKKGMRLQTDPTIIYGKAMLSGKLEMNIRKKDILAPTEYNTYVISGLPPGPIANPGRKALLATVAPEKTDYLYFVSQNDGKTEFSSDYKNHVNAVNRFQKNPEARRGKSWRDSIQ